ncbi:Uncharacterised protein [Serratia fonticola]|uniref:Uncharacterized protein n=1 Tax=Serratia fonticola TaxID=47917 RepID=A0A4U9TXC7_SERFO|nr:Uncharacterised protein [Serratia fonticola]
MTFMMQLRHRLRCAQFPLIMPISSSHSVKTVKPLPRIPVNLLLDFTKKLTVI